LGTKRIMRFLRKNKTAAKLPPLNLQVEGFAVEVHFKPMRNMYIRLKPGHETVFVSAPLRTSQRVIREFVTSKTSWLHDHFRELGEKPDRNLEPSFVEGEIHFIWGRPLRLTFFAPSKASSACHFDDTKLYMPLPMGKADLPTNSLKKLRQLHRQELERHIADILPGWQQQTRTQVDKMSYQAMRSRWGTCHVANRHIRLNTDLARHAAELTEYVLVHELVHFYEHGHNKRFYGFMDKFLPDWKARRKQLNRGLQAPPESDLEVDLEVALDVGLEVTSNTTSNNSRDSNSEPCDVAPLSPAEPTIGYIQLDMRF